MGPDVHRTVMTAVPKTMNEQLQLLLPDEWVILRVFRQGGDGWAAAPVGDRWAAADGLGEA
jgi:hypothetical protein